MPTMRRNLWKVGLLATLGLAIGGCCLFYHRPNIERKFSEVVTGMDKREVMKILGRPTTVFENELWYLYDDPTQPVRLRFVLDSNEAVAQKYYETKAELAKRAKVVEGTVPIKVEPLPGEEGRSYPGGPLPEFEGKKQPGK
jgi:hypothetical protein